MNLKRVAVGSAGAVGGGIAGLIMGLVGGFLSGFTYFGPPVGISLGLINAVFFGGGFAGFISVLFMSCVFVGLGSAVLTGLMMLVGGAFVGSTMGKEKESNGEIVSTTVVE